MTIIFKDGNSLPLFTTSLSARPCLCSRVNCYIWHANMKRREGEQVQEQEQ